MITAFRMGDALRCMLVDAPGGNNLAAPTESIIRCRPLRNSTLWKQSLGRSSNRVTVGDWNGIKLANLASARIRSGVRSWEIDRLHLKDAGQALDLLEQVVYAAGCRGAERVFLRVSCESDMVDAARRAGFFPYYEETHLAGPENTPGPKHEDAKFSVEEPTSSDVQGLFQLYCASTPQEVRQGIGMTIDQWLDSREPAQSHREESILRSGGKIVGWRMSEPFGKSTAGQAIGHPEHPDSIRHLVEMSYQTQNWLVPEYQQNVTELLERQGLREAGRYTMLIKTVSVPVRSREFSYVEA